MAVERFQFRNYPQEQNQKVFDLTYGTEMNASESRALKNVTFSDI